MGLINCFTDCRLAVDVGSSTTRIYVRGRGIVLAEPSVVAIDWRSGDVRAVGTDAKRLIGRTARTIEVIRPVRNGVIADLDVTERMLGYFVHRARRRCWGRPRMIVGVPSGVTQVERRTVEEACLSAGARQVYVIEQPLAAALGAGLPVAEPTGTMIVDIGGGTSEAAVIALGAVVASESVRVGGDALDEAIVNHIKREHRLVIGQPTAEELKRQIGSAHPLAEELQAEIRGWDMVLGAPRTLVLSSEEIRHAIEEPLSKIVDAVKATLGRTPPQLAGDIIARGITLAGAGSLLYALDERFCAELQMPVQVAESPQTCVAIGAGRSLEQLAASHGGRHRARRRSLLTVGLAHR